MKRICSLVIIVAVMLSATSCKAGSQESQGPSTSISETEITESTPETTVYTDETAVIVEYEPVDFPVVDFDDWSFLDVDPSDDSAYDRFANYTIEVVDPEDDLFWDDVEVDWIAGYEYFYTFDALDYNCYYYGLDDPHVLDLINYCYQFENGEDSLPGNVTIDSYDYLNGFDGLDWSDIDSRNYFNYGPSTLQLLASMDHRLDRAIMVALGRRYFVQEIPYSFFEDNYLNDTYDILDDEWYINDYEFLPALEPYYTAEDLRFEFGSTSWLGGYNYSTNEATWTTYEEVYSSGGYIFDWINPFEVLDSGYYYINNSFESLTGPVYRGSYDLSDPEVVVRDVYEFDLSPTPDYEDSDGCDYLDFHGEELYACAYEYLPIDTIACMTAVRYNRQFYTCCRWLSEPIDLYRDQTNGAITMDLDSARMSRVVEAYDTLGYPLQTDDEGNIVAESPAHFREVYGEEYTDVLAEYGIEFEMP